MMFQGVKLQAEVTEGLMREQEKMMPEEMLEESMLEEVEEKRMK